MNVTANGIAIALAVIVALGFLFFGSAIFAPFTPQPSAEELGGTADTETGLPSEEAGAGDAAATTINNGKLMITDTVPGTGAEAVAGKQITVNYVGTLENGQVFDASANHGQPFTFTLGVGQVIAGWDEGFAGMKVGGKRHLVIPADKAYGSQSVGSIPANSTLIFDVELLDVK